MMERGEGEKEREVRRERRGYGARQYRLGRI
jgi:hypothetical protein